MQVQRDVANILGSHFAVDGLVMRCLEYAEKKLDHIMDFTRLRALSSFFSMINYVVRQIQHYNSMHTDFPMAVYLVTF
jgi:dynein heavy chain 1